MSALFNWIIGISLILLLPTAYAAKIGAPYAPTFSAAIRKTFSYINLGKEDVIVDLGAGDGRVLLEAHQRGAQAIGYELSPIMWFITWLRVKIYPLIRRHKGGLKTSVYLRNFYRQKLPAATTVVFAFLMPENMNKVKDFLAKQNLPRARYMLVYSFPFQGIEPVHIIQAPKCGRMYVYDLPGLTDKSTLPSSDVKSMSND